MIVVITKASPSWLMLLIFVMIVRCLEYCHAQTGVSRVNATRNEVACLSVDARNDISSLAYYTNCTVIEGYLQIVLMDKNRESDIDKYSLPNLVEVTDYVLLYRVTKVKTLRKLLPNLAVIGGANLLYHYSLVIYQMFDLEEIGLPSLISVKRGAIRIEKNPVLCYIDMIEWNLISEEHKEMSYFGYNKAQGLCLNSCPEPSGSCRRTLANGETKELCWNEYSCQKVCPAECKDNCYDEGTCCSDLCIGGCTKKSLDPYHCNACRYFVNGGECVRQCPKSHLIWRDHRCVSKEECAQIAFLFKPRNECVDKCPTGYTSNKKSICEQCKSEKCEVRAGCYVYQPIKSLQDAEKLKDCTFIEGSLRIEIKNTANISKGLEDSLGKIEVVSGYVSISHSYALVTLDFLKSLREIKAYEKKNEKYSFYVLGNRNLQKIFTLNNHVNITVRNNSLLSFHENPKLCISEIKKFQKLIKGAADPSEIDISPSSNGHQIACEVNKLDLHFESIESQYISLSWSNHGGWDWDDIRTLLGYQILWRETDSENLTMFDGVGSCGQAGLWDSLDVSPESSSENVMGLKPWKLYAIYVKAFVIKGRQQGAQSDIVYFRTKESKPEEPVKLQVSADSIDQLVVNWKPPIVPNGNITSYQIEYNKRQDDFESFSKRNFCREKKPVLSNTLIDDEEATKPPVESPVEETCACKEEQTLVDEDLAKERSEFENEIQSIVFVYGSRRRRRSIRSVGIANSTANKLPVPTKETGFITNLNTNNVTTLPSVSPTTMQSMEYAVMTQLINITETELNFLDYFSEYIISVAACVGDGPVCGKKVYTVARTKPKADADNIPGKVNLSVAAIENGRGSVLVKWQAPVRPNGPILYFKILCTKSDDMEEDRQDRQSDTGLDENDECVPADDYYNNEGGHVIKNLVPGNYTIKVQATSLGSTGSWTAPVSVSVIVPEPFIERPLPRDDIKLPIIITITVAAVIIVLMLIGSGFYFRRKYRQRQTPDGVLYASVNPEYFSTADMYVPDTSEFPREQLEVIHELGKGSFGMVYQGLAKNIIDGEKVSDVAVKSVQANASMRDRIEFLNEASVMKAIRTHHIVKLLGVVSKGQPTYVIMEYMAQGDLKNWLRIRRPENQADFPAHERKLPPDLKDILRMATEIADGMGFLAYSKFVHRDLSARNCLVAEDGTCKVADFGLARDIYQSDYYRKERGGLLPIRWMAPESIKDGVFQNASDVWSYGVLLWEMATLCELPYQGLSNEEAGEYIKNGNTLPEPEGCPERLHGLMILCWQFQEKHRPTFDEILKNFEEEEDFSGHFHLNSYYHNIVLAYDSMENLDEEELEGISILDKTQDSRQPCSSSQGSDSPRYVERPTVKEENGPKKNGMLHYNGQVGKCTEC